MKKEATKVASEPLNTSTTHFIKRSKTSLISRINHITLSQILLGLGVAHAFAFIDMLFQIIFNLGNVGVAGLILPVFIIGSICSFISGWLLMHKNMATNIFGLLFIIPAIITANWLLPILLQILALPLFILQTIFK